MSDSAFTLVSDQVPEPPQSSTWADILRWAVTVMDPRDPRLAFMASCLSYAIEKEGLTERQVDACEKIFARVLDAYRSRTLVCQNTTRDDQRREPTPLSIVKKEDTP